MALTVTVPNFSAIDQAGLWSPASLKPVKLTGDSSYPGGTGYPVTPGTFGLSQQILAVIPAQTAANLSSQANFAYYDAGNKSIRFLANVTAAVSETVASGTSAASVIIDCFVVGY